MKTVTILIGNSDNKLTQQEWHSFVKDVEQLIWGNSNTIHFSGGPPNHSEYQNWCSVFEMRDEHLESFLKNLKLYRRFYKQDSVALVIGKTQFI